VSNVRIPFGSGSPAFTFVFTMGIVNLFADTAYEGGGSVNGPFLATLGAGAAIVSVTAGFGEFLGYALRPFAGYAADRSGRYWLITFIGYGINLIAVPAMALAGSWPAAAALVLAERIGRAIRKPTVDTMLSYTAGELGHGWVYGLNTALDETGATIGPLVVAVVLAMNGSYQLGYSLLLVPALLALATLAVARIGYPVPAQLEQSQTASARELGRAYWVYMFAGALFAAGLTSFELISYHLARTGVVTVQWIPIFLAVSTGCGAVVSLALGKLFDRFGLRVVLFAVPLSALSSPLVFLGTFGSALFGILLWGIGYATQDTLLKAIVASVLPGTKRNFAFGLYYIGYGAGWLLGSVATGLLYDRSLVLMVVFVVAAQLASMPAFVVADRYGASE
jgi:MFS family permease